MQVSVETTQGLERRLTITVPAATVDVPCAKVEWPGQNPSHRRFPSWQGSGCHHQEDVRCLAHARVADEMMQNNFMKAIIENKLSRLAP